MLVLLPVHFLTQNTMPDNALTSVEFVQNFVVKFRGVHVVTGLQFVVAPLGNNFGGGNFLTDKTLSLPIQIVFGQK